MQAAGVQIFTTAVARVDPQGDQTERPLQLLWNLEHGREIFWGQHTRLQVNMYKAKRFDIPDIDLSHGW